MPTVTLENPPTVISSTRSASPARKTRIIRVGLLGLGRVGQAVARLIDENAAIFARRGVELRIVAALVRDARKPRAFAPRDANITADALEFFGHKFDIAVETLGGVAPTHRYVRDLLKSGVSVVSANKALIAARGAQLARVASAAGVTLRYEAAAIAGVPFIENLKRRPLAARVDRLIGVLNGTSNFIISTLASSRGSFADALQLAQQRGYAEPDPTLDISGQDAADKLAILLQTIGIEGISPRAFEIRGIEALSSTDVRQARALGGAIKPVAYARRTGDAVETFVGPAFVPLGNSLAHLENAQNGVTLEGGEIGSLFFSGPGAGPAITAGTILDDVLEAIAEKEDDDTAKDAATGSSCPTPAVTAPDTAWFVRFRFPQRRTPFVAVPEFLEQNGICVRQLTGAPPASEGDHLYVLTGRCSRATIEGVLARFRKLTRCESLVIRAIEGSAAA